MSNLGKCARCNKTVYVADKPQKVGPPKNEQIYHGMCFKCSNPGCNWQLTNTNFVYCDGKPFCKNHDPMKGFSNQEVKAKATMDGNAIGIHTATSAPKLDTVNTQIHATGGANSSGLDSQLMQHQMHAPKVDVSGSGQIRAGGTHNAGLGDQVTAHAMNAPKLEVAGGGQVRTTGGHSNVVDQTTAHQMQTPKLDVQNSGQIRGGK